MNSIVFAGHPPGQIGSSLSNFLPHHRDGRCKPHRLRWPSSLILPGSNRNPPRPAPSGFQFLGQCRCYHFGKFSWPSGTSPRGPLHTHHPALIHRLDQRVVPPKYLAVSIWSGSTTSKPLTDSLNRALMAALLIRVPSHPFLRKRGSSPGTENLGALWQGSPRSREVAPP